MSYIESYGELYEGVAEMLELEMGSKPDRELIEEVISDLRMDAER